MRAGIFVLVLFFSAAVIGDVIVLKGGQRIEAEILTERNDELVVDLGVSVLTVAKDKILSYEYGGIDEGEIGEVEVIAVADEAELVTAEKLYWQSGRERMGFEECVEMVSEAVVMVSSPGGLGSGFILNGDGYIITNHHVIERETKIEVTVFKDSNQGFERKEFKDVRIVAINPFFDLALLQIVDLDGEELKSVPLGDSDELQIGQDVFAIGNPLGLERTVTNGVISTRNRVFEGLVYLQSNADINPGNSGGPLFNMRGEVIGVTNMGYVFFGGLGFAIPVNYVKHFIENRDAFAYDDKNPNTGYRYLQPKGRESWDESDDKKQDGRN